MSYGETERFNHGDLAGLERKLERERDKAGRGTMIIVDGVYSMEGDIADVPEPRAHRPQARRRAGRRRRALARRARPQGRRHRGALRPDRRGGHHRRHLLQVAGVDRRLRGGARENVIHYLRHHSRPLIFTASLPPANTAGVLAALEVLQTEPERRESLWANTRRLQDGFRQLGFDIGPTETPIVPVLIGPLEKTFIMWRKLFDAGVFTNPVAPPAVPPSQCRLRTSVMATHTFDQIDFCARAVRAHRPRAGGHLSAGHASARCARAGT